MNTLEIILNERDFNFKIFKKINDGETSEIFLGCLLYTSDAADE